MGFAALAFVVITFAAGGAYHWVATKLAEREYAQPGELVDVGGHRLHMRLRGSGGPTVVFDTGLSAAAWEYESIFEGIAQFTILFTYDRAGYGFSDPGPKPRTSQQVVEELHTLLRKADVNPPYILAGHSWGGLNMQLFASLYPDEVAGVVLLDALNVNLFGIEKEHGGIPFLYELLDRTAFLGSARLALPLILRSNATSPLEKKRHEQKLALMARTKTIHAIHDELAGQGNWRTVRAALKPLGNKPLIVISRRIEESDKKEDLRWLEAQQDLVKISTNSKVVIARSKDHGNIEPEVTIAAVRSLVDVAPLNPNAKP